MTIARPAETARKSDFSTDSELDSRVPVCHTMNNQRTVAGSGAPRGVIRLMQPVNAYAASLFAKSLAQFFLNSAVDLRSLWSAGAGEGNRTPVFSLGSCCSTIELDPRGLSNPIHSARCQGLSTQSVASSSTRGTRVFVELPICDFYDCSSLPTTRFAKSGR